MFRINRRWLLLPVLMTLGSACNNYQSSAEKQLFRMDRSKDMAGSYFTHMSDNAILSDMSLADIHFVPHTSELSGIAEVRLERMAPMLSAYGGTVRYETFERDDALVADRLEHVREYLELSGCDMDRVQVAVMMPGGRGMPGDEAVEKYRKGTAESDKSQSGAALMVPTMGSPSQNR